MMLERAKIGIAPLTWTNDDKPEIGGTNTFAQCLSEMALAGYEGCEIGAQFPTDLGILKFELALRNLRIANQWFTFETTLKDVSEIQEAFLRHIRFLKALGTNIVGGGEFGRGIVSLEDIPIIGDGKPRRPILTASEWKTFAGRINALGKIAYEEGMELCFHHHMGTCVETAKETEQLLNDCDAKYVALNYDSGHFYFAGDDPLVALEKFRPRVKHVHLKNIRPNVLSHVKREKLPFLTAVLAGVFTVPGDPEGIIDFEAIFKCLDKGGDRDNDKGNGGDNGEGNGEGSSEGDGVNNDASYANWLIVEAEQDPAKAHPLQTAQLARTYLRQVLGH